MYAIVPCAVDTGFLLLWGFCEITEMKTNRFREPSVTDEVMILRREESLKLTAETEDVFAQADYSLS